MNQDIIKNFPLNGHSLVRSMLESYMERPSFGLELRLNRLKIGVQKTIEGGDDYIRPEGFYMMVEVPTEELTDLELAKIL